MSKAEIVAENSVKLITAKTLAKILSTSVRTVWRLRSAGKLPHAAFLGPLGGTTRGTGLFRFGWMPYGRD